MLERGKTQGSLASKVASPGTWLLMASLPMPCLRATTSHCATLPSLPLLGSSPRACWGCGPPVSAQACNTTGGSSSALLGTTEEVMAGVGKLRYLGRELAAYQRLGQSHAWPNPAGSSYPYPFAPGQAFNGLECC
jgi:hypothetical protein